MTLSKEVWQTLSAVDVSNHVEKKGKLTYLSWAWAYGIMMEHYPDLHYSFEQDVCEVTGTVEIRCSVLVTEKDQTMVRSMWLPVMDHRNKAMVNPDKFSINSSKMRCLTKCFAMFGLGHYIYAGEDLPEAVQNATITESQMNTILLLLHETQSDCRKFCDWMKVEGIDQIQAVHYDRALAALKAKPKIEPMDVMGALDKLVNVK